VSQKYKREGKMKTEFTYFTMIEWLKYIPQVKRGITVIYVVVKNDKGEVIEQRMIRPFK